MRHPGKVQVYNLCAERIYGTEALFHREERFPFVDHNPPPLEMILPFCQHVDGWLKANDKNVVAIHCKAGKGRTGVMVCCYLLYAGLVHSAAAGLQLFGDKRTFNSKGVTIPSQQRFIYYWEQMLLRGIYRSIRPHSQTLQLCYVRLITVPNFDFDAPGCDPYFFVEITNSERKSFPQLLSQSHIVCMCMRMCVD
jgi:phosphatidylinositol-3,4,5-trisphosphate 3-phosphatase/dual-specificity protein phosphatase PTEN